MDRSISLITPEIMRELGAEAYDQGVGFNDHGMNPGAHAIKDWKFGWLGREREVARQQLALSQAKEVA